MKSAEAGAASREAELQSELEHARSAAEKLEVENQEANKVHASETAGLAGHVEKLKAEKDQLASQVGSFIFKGGAQFLGLFCI